jgi:hypothetical protein
MVGEKGKMKHLKELYEQALKDYDELQREKVFIELDDEKQEVLEKIENITNTYYGRKEKIIGVDGLLCATRDILYEYEKLIEYNEQKEKDAYDEWRDSQY